MITELKRTPITFNEKDGWEILIEDTNITYAIGCERCIYSDWNDEIECQAPCHVVHECSIKAPSYFKFLQS